MANIGQFKVGKVWKKLDEVTGYSFVADSSYTIQNKGYQPLYLCIKADAPTTDKIGFIIQQNEKVGYTCESGNFLWIRSEKNIAEFNVAEGV